MLQQFNRGVHTTGVDPTIVSRNRHRRLTYEINDFYENITIHLLLCCVLTTYVFPLENLTLYKSINF